MTTACHEFPSVLRPPMARRGNLVMVLLALIALAATSVSSLNHMSSAGISSYVHDGLRVDPIDGSIWQN